MPDEKFKPTNARRDNSEIMPRKSKKQVGAGAACVIVGVILIILYYLLPVTGVVTEGKRPLPTTVGTIESVGAIGNETTAIFSSPYKSYLTYYLDEGSIRVAVKTTGDWSAWQQPVGGFWTHIDLLVSDSLVLVPYSWDTGTSTVVGVIRSADGGVTFSNITIAEIGNARDADMVRIFKFGGNYYLYLLGTDFLHPESEYRAWFWSSSNGGASWSGPTYKLNLQGLTLASGLTLTSGYVLEMYSDGTKIHLLMQAYSGVFEATRTYTALYGYSSDQGQTFNVNEISQSTLGFSARDISSTKTALVSYGNKIVFTTVAGGKLHWYESSSYGSDWAHYQYSITSQDWLSLGAPLAVYGNTVYAWWFRDNPQTGNPSLIRWDGAGEPSVAVEFTSPTVKSLTAIRASTADRVLVLAGTGYSSSAQTFDDLLIAEYPYEVEGQALTTTPPSWLLYLGVVLTVIGLLLVTTGWRGKEKKKKPARA